MTALLGLLAVAGYQNRDKITEMLGRFRQSPAADRTQSAAGGQGGGFSGILGELGSALKGASAGGS